MLAAYEKILTDGLQPTGTVAENLLNPIGIGAVGGSGTRLLAAILSASGIAMASPLNKAGDALEWPPYRQLLSPSMLERFSRQDILDNTYHAFESLLLQRRENLALDGRAGWKVPGTFHWLKELAVYFPQLQYIHLIRHGLDMAYSGNQNQIANWAQTLGVTVEYMDGDKIRPRSKLEYWLCANERANALARDHLPEGMLVIRFEDLCQHPRTEIERLFNFLELDCTPQHIDNMAAMAKPPASIGRYKDEPWREEFSEDQLTRLEQLNYKV